MIHHFDAEVAEKLGVNAAIIIANLAHLQANRQAQGGEKYYMDGRWWVHHTYESLQKVHPYFSLDQLRRTMKRLLEAEVVFRCHPDRFNRDSYWSVAPEFLQSAESPDGSGEIAGSESAKSPVVLHDNEHITNGRSPTKRFKPPTVAEVAEYCKERGNNVNPATFIDHYEANGWMRGKSKVKCWKACVRTWERNNTPKASTQEPYL